MWYTMCNEEKGAGMVAVAVCHDVEHEELQNRAYTRALAFACVSEKHCAVPATLHAPAVSGEQGRCGGSSAPVGTPTSK